MKRLKYSIQLTLLIFLLPLFQGTAIAQDSEIGSSYQLSMDPLMFYQPLIWMVGLALAGLIVLVVIKGREKKMG
jgi:hypothetical protein